MTAGLKSTHSHGLSGACKGNMLHNTSYKIHPPSFEGRPHLQSSLSRGRREIPMQQTSELGNPPIYTRTHILHPLPHITDRRHTSPSSGSCLHHSIHHRQGVCVSHGRSPDRTYQGHGSKQSSHSNLTASR